MSPESAALLEKDGGSELLLDRQHIPFTTDRGYGARAAVGIIVLASDQVMEPECRRVFDRADVALHHARIRNDPSVNQETLARMEAKLAETADLILPGVRLDVMAYGCTSASMVIGEERVAERIREAKPEAACTTPITAALAAFRALGLKRIALLTPYIDPINRAMRAYIEARGVAVPVMGSFNEENDPTVASIDDASIKAAALEVGGHEAVDGLFIACTNMRLLNFAAELEKTLGKPVTSSNHALAWHCLRLGGIEDALPEFGRLYALPAA